MRRARTLLIIAAVVVVVIAVAAWFLLDANRYKPEVQAKLQEQLKRDVALGDMRLGLLPLRFTVQNLSISDDPEFKASLPFTQAERLDVMVSLMGLLRGNVAIDSIEVVSPKVELIRDEKGVWNFASLAAGAKETKERAVYTPIDITLSNYSPGTPFAFDIAAHLPGGAEPGIRLKGEGGPLPESGPAAMPVKATLSLTAIDVAALRQFLDSEALAMAQGVLSGETQLQSEGGKLSANGKLALDKVRVNNLDVGYPIALDYAVSADPQKSLVQVSSATLKLGPTPLTLTGSIDMNPVPMAVDLRVTTGAATITEIARLASAFGVAFSPDTQVAGQVSGDVRATGPIDKLALSGKVEARDLQISGKDVPQAVKVPTLDLAITPTEIRTNDFQATTGKTIVNGRFALKQYSSKNPTVDASLRAPGATLPEIQSIAKAYGITGLDQLNGPGNLNFDLRASGPLESVASTNVMKTVNGNINLDFNTLKILGFDTTRQLAQLGGFLKNSDPDKGFTDVLKLAGHIVVKNGVAETNDLVANLPGLSLAATGTSDLSAQTLNLRATAVFSKEFSDRVGGTSIGGFLTTALANEKGELVIPAIISGSTTNPKFAPDSRAFLQLQKNRLLPGLSNPRQAITGILGSLTGKKEEPDPNKPPEATEKPTGLKGVLEGFLGGKKK
jgi:uncharacterized protein involved in outer membrane biogenesis